MQKDWQQLKKYYIARSSKMILSRFKATPIKEISQEKSTIFSFFTHCIVISQAYMYMFRVEMQCVKVKGKMVDRRIKKRKKKK